MTTITYNRNNLSITATGHAEYDVLGNDIVCASISVLMYTIGTYAVRLYKGDKVDVEPITKLDNPFDAEVTIRSPKDENSVRDMLDVFAEVFEDIEMMYPNHVHYEVYQ